MNKKIAADSPTPKGHAINIFKLLSMTKLSVNINKIALLRNSRGSNIPDVLQFAKDAIQYGK